MLDVSREAPSDAARELGCGSLDLGPAFAVAEVNSPKLASELSQHARDQLDALHWG